MYIEVSAVSASPPPIPPASIASRASLTVAPMIAESLVMSEAE
jgi:hypothetical protein